MAFKQLTHRERAVIARKLHAASREFVIDWGSTAVCGNHDVAVSADVTLDDEGKASHLVTVMVHTAPGESLIGLPWTLRDSVTRRICRVGQTDARGQFRLQDLVAGKYRLVFECLLSGMAAPVASEFAAARGSTVPLEQDFSDTDVMARLYIDPAGQWMIAVSVGSATDARQMPTLVRFRISAADNRLLVEGFIGLYDGGEYGCGQINVDMLDRTARAQSAGCKIHVMVVAPTDLSSDDLPALELSAAVTEHPASREVLQAAISALK